MGGRSVNPRTPSAAAAAARPTVAGDDSAAAEAWSRRIRSPGFRASLQQVLRAEIADAGKQPVREIVDAARVRTAIAAWDTATVRAPRVARVAVRVNERIEKRLRRERRPIAELIGPEGMEGIDALLEEDLPNPEALEQILARTIRQQFVRKLFAELIHSAILAFNKRVNPFFSGITATVLDAQIKSFIALGMPMLQEQAVAFALSRANQDFVVDLARSLVRGVLAEPLADLVPQASAGQRKRIERLVVRALESERFREAAPAAALRLWDDVYGQLRDEKLGQLVDVERLAEVLVEPLAEMAIAALTRPRIAALLAE